MQTSFGEQRFTGNVVAESGQFGTIVGFENHSAKTYLTNPLSALAHVKSGAGNNGEDKTEGIHYKHVIGSYLYGPLLPKNPAIADYLIAKSLEHRLGEPFDPRELAPLPEADACAAKAAIITLSRPR
jgi:CobQ-like glutamine amidotransferase family enzyme